MRSPLGCGGNNLPSYDFVCSCGGKTTVLIPYRQLAAKKRKPPKCPKCGAKTEFKFPDPAGRVIP